MNFTREPIIETIITPREGCRLVIRSSKGESNEEFTVDAVEVVSFGNALFFRSLERPRPFLVPVSDYEVVEAKESRVVLKNAQFERTIKIGGGREGSLRKEEEEEQVLPVALEEEIADETGETSREPQEHRGESRGDTRGEPRGERKRDRRRHRRRRALEERDEMKHRVEEQTPGASKEASQEPKPEAPKEAPPAFTHLIPPPTTLISESIHKYKEQQSAAPVTPEPEKKEEPNGDSTPISRVALESESFTAPFTSLNDWSNYLS